MAKFVTLWFWQKSRLSAEWFEVCSYTTDEYPHPYLTRQPQSPTSATPWSFSSVDDNGRLLLDLPKDHVPDAPPMWFVLVREYGELVKTQTLVAFVTDHYNEGTVVEVDELKRKGFDPSFMAKRIGAIKWGFGDPHIEQIFVSEEYRRKRISVKLINAADLVNVAGNWGGFIYGGDQVTEMGAELGKAWGNSARLKQTEVHLTPVNY